MSVEIVIASGIVLAFIIILSAIFKIKVISSLPGGGQITLTKEKEEEIKNTTMLMVFEQMKNTLSLIVDAALQSGTDKGVIKHKYIPEQEYLETVKILDDVQLDFIEAYNKMAFAMTQKNVEKVELICFNNFVFRFFDVLERGLKIIYNKDGFENYTQSELISTAYGATNTFISDFNRIIDGYYPDALMTVNAQQLKTLLSTGIPFTGTTSLRSVFEDRILKCLKAASRITDEARQKEERVDNALKEYIARIMTTDRVQIKK